MECTGEMMRTALRAAEEAGSYIFERIGKVREISFKSWINDLVTDVDKASEAIIVGRIKKAFPDHSILAEESGKTGAGGDTPVWVIDPLDGTVNYAHTFPFFCVSIALVTQGVSMLGVVYDPVRKEMFSAERKKGAMLNGAKIEVSPAPDVQSSLVATGFAYSPEKRKANMELFSRMISRAQAVRRPGAAALDLCYVAAGRLDGFWELNLSPWDTAAGYLIVEESGGRVSVLDGSTYDIFKSNILATNGKIHKEMSEILSEKSGIQ
ncbi:MAG TPA: inositol monophosphatase family protein [Candidatus Omnitrophota bacterium]|nr:inositol monophosphatase family protein [Candidatus Omnitrophota bacterium]